MIRRVVAMAASVMLGCGAAPLAVRDEPRRERECTVALRMGESSPTRAWESGALASSPGSESPVPAASESATAERPESPVPAASESPGPAGSESTAHQASESTTHQASESTAHQASDTESAEELPQTSLALVLICDGLAHQVAPAGIETGACFFEPAEGTSLIAARCWWGPHDVHFVVRREQDEVVLRRVPSMEVGARLSVPDGFRVDHL